MRQKCTQLTCSFIAGGTGQMSATTSNELSNKMDDFPQPAFDLLQPVYSNGCF